MKSTDGKKPAIPQKLKGKVKYILYLYVNGSNPSSARSLKNSVEFCENYLDEKY
jgi:hypothetical protein